MKGWILLGFGSLLLLAAMPADAAVQGPCTGTINGQPIQGRITVPENGTVGYQFNTGAPATSWTLSLVMLGASIPVDSGESESDDTVVSGSADVNSYAQYGVGVYELTGVVQTEAGPCTGSVEIVVEGNPLATVVGGVGAAVAVGSAGGATAAAIVAAKGVL